MVRRRNRWMGWAVAGVLALTGCGDTPIVQPDDRVAPFVGTWDAEVFTVTNVADPTVVADLLLNGSFNINVQPSGAYTATLVLGGLTPFIEMGQLSVAGTAITLTPDRPTDCLGSSEYTFAGADHLTLIGPTCFDFNLDGEDEDAIGHIELQRR